MGVGKAAGDPREIAKAIACAVLVGPWIDLINYGVAPPFVHFGASSFYAYVSGNGLAKGRQVTESNLGEERDPERGRYN